jgi:hypothetical protein
VKIFKTIKSVLFNLHFLLFANGFLIAIFLFCRMQDDYENRLFASIAKNITAGEENATQDEVIKKAVSTTYYLLNKRLEVFNSSATGGFLDNVIHPLSADMMTAEGACGSFSAVLCRVMNTMGFTTRFAQMKVDGKYGGHIIIEAKAVNGWVVLDPLYNLCFTRPDGHLASFNDVKADWRWYKGQVPAGYDQRYKYEGVRYNNWNKIPLLMPALKKTLSLFISEEQIGQISLRSYFLKKYTVCANMLLLFILPLSIFIITKLMRFTPYKKIQLPGFLEQQNKRVLRPAA